MTEHQSARAPNVKKLKGALDQYDTERSEPFGRLIFATVRNSVGLKGLRPTPRPIGSS